MTTPTKRGRVRRVPVARCWVVRCKCAGRMAHRSPFYVGPRGAETWAMPNGEWADGKPHEFETLVAAREAAEVATAESNADEYGDSITWKVYRRGRRAK